MKKFLSLLLSVIMLLSIMAGVDLSASAATYDTIAKARSISTGTTYSGTLSQNDEIDYYKFILSSSSELSLKFNSSISSSVEVVFYDSNGKELAYDRPEAGSSGIISFDKTIHLTKGTYYVKIQKYYYGSYGNYSFSLSSTSSNESFIETGTGTNNTIAAANSISLGTTYRGQIALNDEIDYYKFTLSSSFNLLFKFNSSISSSVEVVFYDSNGNELSYDRPEADSSGNISFNKTIYFTKGTYYIKIQKYYYGNYGNYSFSINCSHSWDSGKVTKTATCTSTGVKTYVCKTCGATKTSTIAKTAHTYKTTITKATTKENGKTVKKCSKCGYTVSTAIPYIKSVTLSATSYVYNGKVRKPGVTVKDSKGNKISSKYYTVTYSKGRKAVGTYTVKITFKGNYSGTVKKTFTIKPKATSISKLTAGKKKFTVKWKKLTTQTTGYQIQYSTSSKFTSKTTKTVTVSKNKTTSKTISKLKAKKKYYVRIRTYKTVNGKKIYSAWSKAKSVTTKK